MLADEWSWETLRAPDYTAATRYLWSKEVNECLGVLRKICLTYNGSTQGLCYSVSDDVMAQCVPASTAGVRARVARALRRESTSGVAVLRDFSRSL
jgi:hypothetical protein